MEQTLQQYVEQKRSEYQAWQEEGRARGYSRSQPFEEENLIWAIQEYLSYQGDFSEVDTQYLEALGYLPEDFQDEDIYEVNIYGVQGEFLYSETHYNYTTAEEAYSRYQEDGDFVELKEVDRQGMPFEGSYYRCNFEYEQGKLIKREE
jgi:hypothetical protein